MTQRSSNRGGLVRVGDLAGGMLKPPAPNAPLVPKQTHPENNLPEQPSSPDFENAQLNLFQNFLCNTDEERERFSNAIDLWDSVPRYSISRQAMTKARMHGRFLGKHTATFQHKQRTYTRTITPAQVIDLDGEERFYYPSATEELVEDALRKLAADQQAGFFDKPNYRSGVVFSLYALREELKNRGHSRSYQEIILALDILSHSIIEIVPQEPEKGEGLVRAPYLPSVVAVSRTTLKDDPKARWAVQFHPFVTGSIDQVTYRQFNYHLMMSHSTQLARWLHKLLVLKYTFADYTKPFETRYSTIKRDSGLLDSYARDRDAIQTLEKAFSNLKDRDVLLSCERRDVIGPRKKLLDVVFQILPSYSFIREAKAANKRLTDARQNGLLRR